MRAYPGYTLRTLDEEDAHRLLAMRALLEPGVGRADDDGEP